VACTLITARTKDRIVVGRLSDLSQYLEDPGPQPRETGTLPFFCVPGIGGSVLQLNALAQRLGTATPLVALRVVFDSEHGPDRVEDFAARAVKTMLDHQPRGPFLLGGYSGGATIAFAMAQQLTALGHEVALLALIDTRRPGWRLSARTAPMVAFNFIRNIRGWLRDDLAHSSPRQAWKDVRRHVRQFAGRGMGVEKIIDLSRYPPELRAAMQREYDMLDAYRPLPWQGRIVLLRAQTQPLLLWHDEAALGWSGLARGGMEIITLPGNHMTMMREPSVSALATALRACIRRVSAELEAASVY
jgi:thioesterase domain-containing protein